MLSELVLPQVALHHPRPTLFMGLVKVRYRQYFLHQKFYKTPKTKYIILSQENSCIMLSKRSFFTFSSHAGKSISAFLKLRTKDNKICYYVCFVDMNKNLSYLKKALKRSLLLIQIFSNAI